MEQNRRLNNKGQIAIEAVLLMILFVGIFASSMKFLRDKAFLQTLTDRSVTKIKNMAEYGTWQEQCKALKGGSSQTAANCHPNSINRALSSDPQ
jgi:hypothetical protein